MVYVEISDFFDERQPRYDHSKNDLKYTPSGAILEWFWGGAPAAPREGLGSNSIWLWTYPMGTWSPMIPKQSYQIWPFPATVWGTHGSRLKLWYSIVLCSTLDHSVHPPSQNLGVDASTSIEINVWNSPQIIDFWQENSNSQFCHFFLKIDFLDRIVLTVCVIYL